MSIKITPGEWVVKKDCITDSKGYGIAKILISNDPQKTNKEALQEHLHNQYAISEVPNMIKCLEDVVNSNALDFAKAIQNAENLLKRLKNEN